MKAALFIKRLLSQNPPGKPSEPMVKKIVVLGPNADNRISILGNYNGNPSKVVSLLDGLKEKLGSSVEII